MPQNLNHQANIYLAVTLSPQTSLFNDPTNLSSAHPSLTHQGKVGALDDVQLYSIAKPDWHNIQNEVMSAIHAREGVIRVDVVPEPRQRAKRDEF